MVGFYEVGVEHMKTVILCGGYGTRIRDVADNIPKPMIPIGKLPILWHLMNYYAGFGHDDFVLCLGYKGGSIRNFFDNYSSQSGQGELKWNVTLADTGEDSMTGARIRKIREHVKDEPFMLTYGDGLSDIDINSLITYHQSKNTTVTVTGVRPPARFGELEVGSDGKATGFNEKPQASAGLISGGFFVCEPAVFDVLEDRQDLVFEKEPMQSLVAQKELAVYQHDGFWQCMDTYRDWQLLNEMLEQGKAPWKTS